MCCVEKLFAENFSAPHRFDNKKQRAKTRVYRCELHEALNSIRLNVERGRNQVPIWIKT